MTWKLWLDDQLDDPETPVRHVPSGFIGAKSSDEALKLIEEHGMPLFIDFDFDLGGTDTAQCFLYSLENMFPNGPVPGYNVHSENVYAEKMIGAFMRSWERVVSLMDLSLIEAGMEGAKNK